MTEVKWDSGAPKISARSPKNPNFSWIKRQKTRNSLKKAKDTSKARKTKIMKKPARKNVESLKKLA